MRRREFLLASAGVAAAPAGLCAFCLCAEAAPAIAAAPVAHCRLVAYGPQGQPLPAEAYNSLLLTDSANNPFPRAALEKALPAGPFLISLPLAVPDFGHVYLFADNGGRGYRARDIAGRELLLNYEFSLSRVSAVERYLEKHGKAGFRFSPEVAARLERARTAQTQALDSRKDPAACARLANESLAQSLWAGEMAVIEKARQQIEKRGARPGFLFGCNAFAAVSRGREYTRLFEELLNYATLPFYRSATEKDEGAVDYSRVDRILGWAGPAGIKTKGHPLVWFHRAGIPEWMKNRDFAAARRLHREYILKSVAKYRPWIPIWDVINEAHDSANILNYTAEQLAEMTRLAAETVREADPTAFRVVNCCCTWSEHVASGRSQTGPLGRPARSVLNYVKEVIAARVPFEAIGLQVYYPARDMFEIDRHLDLFGALGKPIHITELGVSAGDASVERGEIRRPNPRHWHGDQWTEQVQADWAEQFYTIAYSKPYIDAITWWDFADPAFIPHGGFLTPELKPRESYHRLLALRRKWSAMA